MVQEVICDESYSGLGHAWISIIKFTNRPNCEMIWDVKFQKFFLELHRFRRQLTREQLNSALMRLTGHTDVSNCDVIKDSGSDRGHSTPDTT